MSKNLLIASDHAGYRLKQSLISLMDDIFFEDLGTDSDKSVDYPDFAKKLIDILKNDPLKKGVYYINMCAVAAESEVGVTSNIHVILIFLQ